MNKRVLLLIAAGLAAASCAEMRVANPPPPTTLPCAHSCEVIVTVIPSGNGCSVSAISADIVAVTRDQQPTNIRWSLSHDTGNAYKFLQSNAIVFDKTPAPPAGVMQNGNGAGRTVTVNDKHTGDSTKGHWAYTIYVTDGNVVCSKDPWVDNT